MIEFHPTSDQVRALANPQLRAELENLGLRILRTFGGTTYLVPAEHAEYISTRCTPHAPPAELVVEPDDLEQQLRNEVIRRRDAGWPRDPATGLTQNQVMKRFGVGRSRVQRLERELGRPDHHQ